MSLPGTIALKRDSRNNAASARVNVSKSERVLSLGVGAALLGLGLIQPSKLGKLLTAAVGALVVYRGATGHCHIYQAIGMELPVAQSDLTHRETKQGPQNQNIEYAGRNQLDKDRFDKLKATQVQRGRDELEATEIAAEEVKELRRREGRAKDDDTIFLDKYDPAWERRKS